MQFGEFLSLIMLILVFLVGFIISAAIYLIPTIIAVKVDHPNKTAIIVLNILGGWTFIVWVIALVWSLTKPAQVYSAPVMVVQQQSNISAPQQHHSNARQVIAHSPGIPKLVGISGQYAGQTIDLSHGQVAIGRDPQYSQLAYPYSYSNISRKHCIVQYDDTTQKFIIEDTSSNGTFVYPQERLTHGQPVYLEKGARFYLSDPSEQYELRLE